MAWRPHREPAWRRLLERWGQPRPSMSDLADELMEHQYEESLSITTNREPHVTDQPNVEPTPELGITLEQAQANIGAPVAYYAPRPGPGSELPSYRELGMISSVPERGGSLSEQVRQVFVKFDGAGPVAKLTPLDRLVLIGPVLPGVRAMVEKDAAEDDESALSELAKALYSHGVAQNEITPSMDENDALGLARVALDWMRGRFIESAKANASAGPPIVTSGYPAPLQPAMPYPMQWGEQPPPWGQQQPPPVPAELPDLIEQREWLPVVTPHAAGDRVIYRGRPTDPPLLALVVSVAQSPSGVSAVAQYTVRVPYLGQTLSAYADQLATWHEPEPDF